MGGKAKIREIVSLCVILIGIMIHERFLGAFAKLWKRTISYVMSVFPFVCMDKWTGRLSNWEDFHNICIRVSFVVLSRKFKFHKNLTRIMVALHDYLCTFMIFSRGIVLRMRNLSDRSCRENQSTHIWGSIIFFPPKIVPFIWDNVGKYGTAGNTTVIRHMRVACWVAKAANTHSHYIILIAVERQQWLRERA